MSTVWPVRELVEADRPALERHLLALEGEDRRLRFGSPMADVAVQRYVAGINFETDAVFGVFNDELELLAAAHLARAREYAELGVSVLPGQRNRGLGAALLARAVMHARNWAVGELFMHCLKENTAMMHLARKQEMRIVTECGEADAWLKLPRPDAGTFLGEVFAQRLGLFDFALKSQRANTRRLLEVLV
ncbi:MAG TPA: GNAT family N-acetyltransferase [Burkholderiales bacterium]